MASRRIIEEDSYQTTPRASDSNTVPLYGQVTFDPEVIDTQLKEERLRRKVAPQESEVSTGDMLSRYFFCLIYVPEKSRHYCKG
jgi:hypothetical protein